MLKDYCEKIKVWLTAIIEYFHMNNKSLANVYNWVLSYEQDLEHIIGEKQLDLS